MKNYEIKNKCDEAILRAYEMLRARAAYYHTSIYAPQQAIGDAYENSAIILKCAMTNDLAGLDELDYI